MFGRRTAILITSMAMLIAACTPSSEDVATTATTVGAPTPTTTLHVATVQTLTAEDFPAFMEDISTELLKRVPEDVTDLGLADTLGQNNDTLNNLSLAFREETAAIAARALVRLDTLPQGSLEGDDAISASVLRWYLEDITALAEYPHHDYAVNYITGAHTNFPEFMADVHPITDASDADAYIGRLHAAAEQMRQIADNLAASATYGILPTTNGLDVAGWQVDNTLIPAEDHPLVMDLVERLEALGIFSPDEMGDYEQRAISAVETRVLPGYEDLLDAINTVSGRSEAAPGIGEVPDGAAYYEEILRHHITVDMTPEEVHQLGLTNVDRLMPEVTEVLTELGYDVDQIGFARAIGQAYGGAGFFPLSSESDRQHVLDVTSQEIEDAETAFAPMFTTFPESDVVVVRPRPGREGGAGAYYRPPPILGSRPGIYYLNLAGSAFGKQTFRTTNYHEAVPGHHFQIALQRESADLPLLQQAATFTGFAEGWALYAERLAYEAGLYDDDPYGNLGRLQMELLRAVRVVTDTGIHWDGWSRDEAIRYMMDHGFAESWASNEVDRYIVWPGQAPAYMIGMLEILRLREETEAALGPEFDIAAFHDEILRHGSLPVELLNDVVDGYIASQG